MRTEKNFVYILRCNDQTLYTGWTNHLQNRIKAHNEGKGAKYTKSRLPVSLAYCEVFETKSEALKREITIKKLSKIQKQELMKDFKLNKIDV